MQQFVFRKAKHALAFFIAFMLIFPASLALAMEDNDTLETGDPGDIRDQFEIDLGDFGDDPDDDEEEEDEEEEETEEETEEEESTSEEEEEETVSDEEETSDDGAIDFLVTGFHMSSFAETTEEERGPVGDIYEDHILVTACTKNTPDTNTASTSIEMTINGAIAESGSVYSYYYDMDETPYYGDSFDDSDENPYSADIFDDRGVGLTDGYVCIASHFFYSLQYFGVTAGNDYEVQVVIDPDDEVEESDESNNEFVDTISMPYPEDVLPDPAVGEVYLEESGDMESGEYVLNVVIENQGQALYTNSAHTYLDWGVHEYFTEVVVDGETYVYDWWDIFYDDIQSGDTNTFWHAGGQRFIRLRMFLMEQRFP